MNRSPLAYPLARGIDADTGGAADLQTDIMRFMAILSLCLVAIFALVQSIPLAPETPAPELVRMTIPADAEVPAAGEPVPPAEVVRPAPGKAAQTVTTVPLPAAGSARTETQPARPEPLAVPAESPPPAKSASPDAEGFTLRFESDVALTRLVAAGRVGFFAIGTGRAQRMTVSDSRFAFWDASMPGEFHEMDAGTVPGPVVRALSRTGVDAASIVWGVTLPVRLQSRLAALMRERSGGALVIGADGSLALEAS